MIPQLMPFQDLPFNGDNYICETFLKLKEKYQIHTAIETGSCLYSTTKWLGENFDKVLTVEINQEFANWGKHKIDGMPHVIPFYGDSVDFIKKDIFPFIENDKCIFFLDAHWGNICPLKGELKGIAELNLKNPPIIAIHDFYTGNEDLGYDSYNGQRFDNTFIYDDIIRLVETYGVEYDWFFNIEAEGAKRGIIYITPQQPQNDLDSPTTDNTDMEEV